MLSVVLSQGVICRLCFITLALLRNVFYFQCFNKNNGIAFEKCVFRRIKIKPNLFSDISIVDRK